MHFLLAIAVNIGNISYRDKANLSFDMAGLSYIYALLSNYGWILSGISDEAVSFQSWQVTCTQRQPHQTRRWNQRADKG